MIVASSRGTLHRRVRPRHSDDHEDERDEQDERREVAEPPRLAIDDVRQQIRVPEPRLRRDPPAVPIDVERDEDRQSGERAEDERPVEAHARLLRRNVTSGRSQSPDVLRTTCRTPIDENVARHLAPFGCRGDGEALAETTAARVDAELPSGLGIDEPEEPDVGQLLLARIADLDGDDVVVPRELEQRPPPLAVAAKVGDDHDERALSRKRACAREGVREATSLPGPPSARLAAQRGEQADQADAPLTRRDRSGLAAAERDDAEAVPAARGEVTDRDGDALRHVGLAPVGRAELHRHGGVEHEPRHEHALGEVDADVWLARSGGRVPVDAANVVARDVRAHHRELRSRAEQVRAEVAREQALDPATDGDVQRAEQALGHRAGPGTRRRRPREKRAGVPHASRASCRAGAREVELRHRNGGEHLVEDRVGGHLLRERLVRQDEPVSQGVACASACRSSTIAYSRPRISASARAPWTRLIGPRGLAP